MAVLNLQISGTAKKGGQTLQIPPAEALIHRGPCIQVSISVPNHIAQQLVAANKPVPSPITGQALIDTGATKTSIDQEIATKLELPVVGIGKMNSASHDGVERNLYPITIELVGLVKQVNLPQALSVELKSHGLIAIIGRDMLAKGCLIYNGKNGSFTLAF